MVNGVDRHVWGCDVWQGGCFYNHHRMDKSKRGKEKLSFFCSGQDLITAVGKSVDSYIDIDNIRN